MRIDAFGIHAAFFIDRIYSNAIFKFHFQRIIKSKVGCS